MDNCGSLIWYGTCVLLLAGGLIVIPYLRGKADLISAWSILLLGIGIFLGLGCFEAATIPLRTMGLEWFAPSPQEVAWFIAANTLFLITLLATYYYDPISRAVAARCLNNWPPMSTSVLLFVVILCFVLAMALMSTSLLSILFVGQVVVNVSHKAMVFTSLFSLVLWYRNRLNPVWLALFVAVFCSMCIMGILAGHGRRMLLSVLMVPVVVVYYYHVRRWRPTRGMLAVAVGALALFALELMYDSMRHFDWQQKQERTAASVVQQIRNIGSSNWMEKFARNRLFHFSQQTVHYSLVADHFVRSGALQPKLFNTFKFFLAYPIPRAIWPEKPQVLGVIIVRDFAGVGKNWGPGIAGQSAYEGGLIVAVMFGYLGAFGARLFVDPLQRQPTNPFLLAMLASAGPHILGWPRGDLSNFTIDIAECVFFTIALGILCRILFGTDKTKARNSMYTPPNTYDSLVPGRSPG
jgi:hypothetical protein